MRAIAWCRKTKNRKILQKPHRAHKRSTTAATQTTMLLALFTMPKRQGKKKDESSYIESSPSPALDMITSGVASKEFYNNVNIASSDDGNSYDDANHRVASTAEGRSSLWNTSFRSIDNSPLQVQSGTDLDLSASVFDTAVMDDPWRVYAMARQNVAATAQEGGFCYEDNEGSLKKKGKYHSTSAAATATASTNGQDQCDVSPTPLSEAANLNIVDEISRLPRSLLVEGNDMRALLQPLLKKDPPSNATMMKVSKEASSTSSVATSTTRRTGRASSSAAASSPVKKGSSSSSDGRLTADDSDGSSSSSASSSPSSSSERGAAAIAIASDRHKHDQWNDRFQKLIEYKRRHKDCDVPYRDSANQPLAQWVKRQRYQHGLKVRGKHSNLTDERQSLLESIGFVWDSRQSNWDDRFEELKSYKEQHGHVRISPTTQDPRFRALAVWLKRQRIYARNFRSGNSSSGGMTEERFTLLLSLGVEIDAKRSSKKKKKGT